MATSRSSFCFYTSCDEFLFNN